MVVAYGVVLLWSELGDEDWSLIFRSAEWGEGVTFSKTGTEDNEFRYNFSWRKHIYNPHHRPNYEGTCTCKLWIIFTKIFLSDNVTSAFYLTSNYLDYNREKMYKRVIKLSSFFWAPSIQLFMLCYTESKPILWIAPFLYISLFTIRIPVILHTIMLYYSLCYNLRFLISTVDRKWIRMYVSLVKYVRIIMT